MSLGSSSILTRPTTTSTRSAPVHAKTRRASSPTSIMSLGSTLSALSFGKSPTATNSTPQSPTRMIRSFSREKNVLSSVTFSIHLEHDPQDETNGILTITIESAKDLPLRDYGAPCDVMVHVSLHRDRRSLRKRSRHVFADFKTDVVKQDQNPSFGQSFKTNVPWSDYKNLRMKLSAFDHDRHSKVTEIGTTSLYLKEIKHLNTSAEGLIMTNFLAQKKQEYGELMFGMSYLPTAQRLSFSIMKATNLKYEEIVSNLDDFVPYVRILQLSASGKVVKKKKTSIRPGTKEPAFNETLNFDLNPNQLESTAFMVLLSHKQTSFELQDMDSSSFPETQLPLSERSDSGMSPSPIPSPRPDESAYTQGPTNGHSHGHAHYRLRHRHQGKDLCLGRIVMGSFVRGERERGHWASVIATPRKVFTMWQTLY
ncbi:hypothetical protein TCAL_15707 [Tigriopus californicus]|uniref:C2 domain-containing protein n=2 Tax=Tigriopus californicus TaxID=6832 RepID=A0A553P5Z7_TIGCA|nr:hypothetical protein TCAL_15707 [Tigriopus californicus]